MVRGLPAYEWWKNPPDEVLLRVYLFNVTNSEQFESGIDSKLELNEIGPIVFRYVYIFFSLILTAIFIMAVKFRQIDFFFSPFFSFIKFIRTCSAFE